MDLKSYFNNNMYEKYIIILDHRNLMIGGIIKYEDCLKRMSLTFEFVNSNFCFV